MPIRPSSSLARRHEEDVRRVIRVLRNLSVLGVIALLVLPAAAQASALTDCVRDNDLDRQYPNSELQKALDNLPTDSDEYGNCREILAGAITSGSDKGDNRPGDSGPDGQPLSAKEQTDRQKDNEALADIAGDNGSAQTPTVDVGGETVEPGDNGLFDLASASNDLPTPLLAALIALAVLPWPACSSPCAGAFRCSRACRSYPRSRRRVLRLHAPRAADVILGGALAGVAFGAAGGSELSRTTIVEVLVVLVGGAVVAVAVAWARPGPVHGATALRCSPRWPWSPRCR